MILPNKIFTVSFILLSNLFLYTNQLNGQLQENGNILNQFDKLIGYTNSGLYFGKPNTPYPNIDEGNNPFFETIEYQNADIVYKNQPYFNVQIRYDLVRDDIQILPQKELDLLGITLFSDFVSSFSINSIYFIKVAQEQSGKKFFQVLLDNPAFKLLKSHSKKEKERLRDRNVIYTEYVMDTSLFVLAKGQLQPANTKKQLLSIFSENKEALNKIFQENKNLKVTKEALIVAVLKDWQTIVSTSNTMR